VWLNGRDARPGLSLAESVQQQWAALEAFHAAGKAKAISHAGW
jgi:hypothetical protein